MSDLPELPEPIAKVVVNADGAWIESSRGRGMPLFDADQMRAYALAAVAMEREACAKVCESLFDSEDDSCNEAEQCAAAIRARG